MKKKAIFIVIITITFLVLVFLGIYYFWKKPSPMPQNLLENQITHLRCLGDDEIANYEINKRGLIGANAVINILNKTDNNIIYNFVIDGIFRSAYPIELHRCGVYVMRMFNYDVDKIKQEDGFRIELWKYDYNGKGENILLLNVYDLNFRVDPAEIYIALVQGKSQEPEGYGYAIKNQQTKQDSFILLYPTILRMNPGLEGYLDLEVWTKDGNYFWGDVSVGAPRLGYVRIKRDNWEYDVLPAPAGTEGGTAFNPEYGYITYDTGPPWVGLDVIQEEIAKEWRQEGKTASFYLYNLFTKDQILLATTTEPFWQFRPQWLSENELKYSDPQKGEMIYKIQ